MGRAGGVPRDVHRYHCDHRDNGQCRRCRTGQTGLHQNTYDQGCWIKNLHRITIMPPSHLQKTSMSCTTMEEKTSGLNHKRLNCNFASQCGLAIAARGAYSHTRATNKKGLQNHSQWCTHSMLQTLSRKSDCATSSQPC